MVRCSRQRSCQFRITDNAGGALSDGIGKRLLVDKSEFALVVADDMTSGPLPQKPDIGEQETA